MLIGCVLKKWLTNSDSRELNQVRGQSFVPELMNHSNFGRSPHVPLFSLKPSYAESTRLSATGNKRCWEHKKSTAWNVQCAAESSELRSPRCRRVDAREAEGLVDGWRRILDRKRHLSEWVVGPDGKPDDDYKAAVEPRFVQWVVDTFQLSIKKGSISGRNCLTTYPAKKNMTDALGSTRAASRRCSLKDCPASLPRAGYATAVSPTKMPYELASMRVADFERSIIQIGPRSAFMRIASAGTTHRAHQSTRNGCRRPMRR